MTFEENNRAGAAQAAPAVEPSPGEARKWQPRAPRTTRVMIVGRLVNAAGEDALCRVQNISSGGLMVHCELRLQSFDRIRIELRSGRVLCGRVMWTKPPLAGIQFDEPIDVEQTLAPAAMPRILRGAQRPRPPRFPAAAVALVRAAGVNRPATVQNLSIGGAGLSVPGGLLAGEEVKVAITGLPTLRAVVRWSEGEESGVAFLDTLHYEDLAPWLLEPALRHSKRASD